MIDIEKLEAALHNADLWQPSEKAKVTYQDYNLYVQAARAYLEMQKGKAANV